METPVTMGAGAADWFGTDLPTLAYVALSALGIYAGVIAVVRLNGLRSFGQMSAFDFAATVAIGTILATTMLSSEVSLPEGVFAAGVLLGMQSLVSVLRRRTTFGAVVDNRPTVILRDGEILEANLAQTNLARKDLLAKLRQAGVRSLGDVALVVLETTGQISVIERSDGELDRRLLEDLDG